jgi:hypothetical protein
VELKVISWLVVKPAASSFTRSKDPLFAGLSVTMPDMTAISVVKQDHLAVASNANIQLSVWRLTAVVDIQITVLSYTPSAVMRGMVWPSIERADARSLEWNVTRNVSSPI